MKATDLRIGNKFECMGMIQTVFEICDNTDRGKIKQNGYEHIIRCIENGNQYKPIEINYIPLTEDWLLKFGFHESPLDEIIIFKKGKMRITSITHSVVWDGAFICFCHNVHQLQNLYFALTGEELITAIV